MRRTWDAVTHWMLRHDLDHLIDDVRELGLASQAESPSEALSKTMHDVRGGALSALLGRLQLLEHLPRVEKHLKAIFVQTRDHLKIMRNAVTGLDEPRRGADQTPKSHAMRLMIDKWHDSVVGPKWRERPILMDIRCQYDGALTECCLESAAIDRIFYNLASNASRYTADKHLEMEIFPLPEPPGESLRFVLSNRVGEFDAAKLRSMVLDGGADSADRGTGLSLLGLFEPGVSSTGSGFGLTVPALRAELDQVRKGFIYRFGFRVDRGSGFRGGSLRAAGSCRGAPRALRWRSARRRDLPCVVSLADGE